MTTGLWDRWLRKDYGKRGERRLREAIEQVTEGRKNIRIAHIEDDSTDADLICFALQRSGWKVTSFSSYQQALGSLVDSDLSKFDCVLSDIMLPAGWEGLRLAAIIKNKMPTLPIIMYTNRAEPDPSVAERMIA